MTEARSEEYMLGKAVTFSDWMKENSLTRMSAESEDGNEKSRGDSLIQLRMTCATLNLAPENTAWPRWSLAEGGM